MELYPRIFLQLCQTARVISDVVVKLNRLDNLPCSLRSEEWRKMVVVEGDKQTPVTIWLGLYHTAYSTWLKSKSNDNCQINCILRTMLRSILRPILSFTRPSHIRCMSSQDSTSGRSYQTDDAKLAEMENNDDAPPLPLLQRPLGLKDPPTTTQMTRRDHLNEMLDQNKRMDKRRHLYVLFPSA